MCDRQSLKAGAEASDLLQTMRMAKERLERDLERLQNREDSSDSLRRRLRETEVLQPTTTSAGRWRRSHGHQLWPILI